MQFELFPFNFHFLIRVFVSFAVAARVLLLVYMRTYLFVCWEIECIYLISFTYTHSVRRALIWHFKMISPFQTMNIEHAANILCYRVFTLSTFYFICCKKFCSRSHIYLYTYQEFAGELFLYIFSCPPNHFISGALLHSLKMVCANINAFECMSSSLK